MPIRRLPTLKVSRVPTGTRLHPRVEYALRADAHRFKCSRSMVQNAIITDHYERVLGRTYEPTKLPQDIRSRERRKRTA